MIKATELNLTSEFSCVSGENVDFYLDRAQIVSTSLVAQTKKKIRTQYFVNEHDCLDFIFFYVGVNLLEPEINFR